MNYTKEQIEQIKTHLEDYLKETKRDIRNNFSCVSTDHEDKNPSMSYNQKANNIKCFSCNKSYDLISLYALDNNLDNNKDFIKIIDSLASKYNIKADKKQFKPQEKATQEDFTKYYKEVLKEKDPSNYLEQKRGINTELIKKYKIGYDKTKKQIIMPVTKHFYIGRSTADDASIKHYKPKDAKQELFNAENLKNSTYKDVVFITESIIDALSLETIDANIKTVALNSTTFSNNLIDQIKNNKYKGAIVLALDTDHAGIRASTELKENLEDLNVKTYIINTTQDSYKGNKDINDFLIKDKEALREKATYSNDAIKKSLKDEAFKILQQENALSFLDQFNEYVKDTSNNQPQPTGIKRLDNVLDGGLFKKNLVIIGAISSLGKTTLALQIADGVAKQNKDVLVFSLEMSKEELIAKSLSREMFLNARDNNIATYKTLGARDILKGIMYNPRQPDHAETLNLYEKAQTHYKNNIAEKVFITECNETEALNTKTIEARIKRQIEITEEKPLVIIDYLQIIQSEATNLTDKQAVDRIIVNLKRMARENDITIIVISAFNRSSYNQESNLASFRDTSTIEYTADVLMALEHEGMRNHKDEAKTKTAINDGQKKDVRDLTLKIIKNRNGKITDIEGIKFYAKNNYIDFPLFTKTGDAIKD